MRPYEYITDDYRAAQAVYQDIYQLQPRLKFVGLDSETTGLDPLVDKLRLVQAATPAKTYVFDIFKLGIDGLLALKNLVENFSVYKICHNGKFDSQFIRKGLCAIGILPLIDTMLAHQLVACGNIQESVSLEASAARFLDISLKKELQKSDWSRPTLTDAQIRYAAMDAEILLDLWPEQRKVLEQQGQLSVAQIEFEAVNACASIELNGIMLDRFRWIFLYEDTLAAWEAKRLEIQLILSEHHRPNGQGTLFEDAALINVGSQPQMVAALQNYGVPVPVDPHSGRPTLAKFFLNPLARDYPVIQYMLEYSELEKARSSYGPKWLDKISPVDGRIHADIRQIGAETGRMAMWNPNLQQIKQDIRYRRCFVAEPGNVLTWADLGQGELRIACHLSRDRAMRDAFESGMDFHTATAMMVFDKPAAQVTQTERYFAKRLNFGIVYGIGAQRFAWMCNISLEMAEDIIKRYLRTYYVLDGWLRDAARSAVALGYSKTLSGRVMKWIFDKDDRQQVALTQRNGKNGPIQGLNADIIKRAMHLIDNELLGQDEIRMIHVVHDELVFEHRPEHTALVQDMCKTYMTMAGEEFIDFVPVIVDTHTGPEWAKGDE